MLPESNNRLPQPTDAIGREKAHRALFTLRLDPTETDLSGPAVTQRLPSTLR